MNISEYRPASQTQMIREDHLRILTRVARMYHELGMRQSEIAQELHISQPRVSRLLKRAEEVGVVRTTVVVPVGLHTDLEEQLEEIFDLESAVVANVASDDEGEITAALGSATAEYLSATLLGDDTIGVSSWSSTLLAAVRALPPFRTRVADYVVQTVGGVGAPTAEMFAAELVTQLASATKADAVFLPAPGVLGSSAVASALMADPSVSRVMELWANLTTILVGIGDVDPSPLLRQSGNIVSDESLNQLREAGAVGDVCLRFYNEHGEHVKTEFNDRVVGISAEQFRRVPRRIGAAGGQRKLTSIRAALEGGWVNNLITDVNTANELIQSTRRADDGPH